MIRQAHTYLVGAMSGATLIAIAIAAFVVLVSAQVFRDWPIAALGSGNDAGAVSEARPAGGGAGGTGAASATPATTVAPTAGGGNGAGGAARGGAGGGSTPAATVESGSGSGSGGTGSGGGGGGQGGSGAPAPSPTPAASSPAGTGSNSGGGGSGGGNGGNGPVDTPPIPTGGKVAETVNDTVNQVDETATGGALNEAGVTEVTEGVVNGVAGPESAVGKVVDETAGAVEGVLGGKP